jgi:hypothetical protein
MAKNRSKVVGEVIDMSFHRNGVSGRGFWNIIFKGHPDADSIVAGYTFVATFFAKEEQDKCDECEHEGDVACVAVLRLDDLNEGHAEQAWRGDTFHGELQTLVDSYVWRFDRQDDLKYDGAGREVNRRREAIEATKAKRSKVSS